MSKKEQEISAGTKIHKFNHISQNIKLAANIREYYNTQHSFKRSVLAKNNKQNLQLIGELNQSVERDKRDLLIKKSKKWDKFREVRITVIDKYIKQRRIQ